MIFRDWYNLNQAVLKFDDVIIRCMREESEHECDALFKCKLNWKDAIKLFGDYALVSICQGFIKEGPRLETYYTIQCTIHPMWDNLEEVIEE